MRAIVSMPILAALGTVAAAQTTTEPAPDPATVFSENCAACHQADGKGIEGAFPALAGDKFVLGLAAAPIHVVLEGRGGMPTFRGDLSDAQIAAALTFVRTSWGNKASPVTAAEVTSLRGGATSAKNTGH